MSKDARLEYHRLKCCTKEADYKILYRVMRTSMSQIDSSWVKGMNCPLNDIKPSNLPIIVIPQMHLLQVRPSGMSLQIDTVFSNDSLENLNICNDAVVCFIMCLPLGYSFINDIKHILLIYIIHTHIHITHAFLSIKFWWQWYHRRVNNRFSWWLGIRNRLWWWLRSVYFIAIHTKAS